MAFHSNAELSRLLDDVPMTPSSKGCYQASLARLCRVWGGNLHQAMAESPHELKAKILERVPAPNTRKIDCQTCLKLNTSLALVPPDSPFLRLFVDWFTVLKVQSADLNREKQETQVVPRWDEYLRRCDDAFGDTSRESLIAHLYSSCPVRDDLGRDMLLCSSLPRERGNWLVLMGPLARLVIQNHKTAKQHGDLEYALSRPLSDKIRRFVIMEGRGEGDPLFDAERLTGVVQRMNHRLGYEGGVGLFRHMHAASQAGASAEDRVELARRMGHCPVRTAPAYVRPLG